MNIPEIDPRDVTADEHKLIDVRTPDEFSGELGHVPGSRLVEMGDDLVRELKVCDKSEKIVFICRSGNRSGQVTAYALEQGFVSVFNMTGGMILWNDLGLPTEK